MLYPRYALGAVLAALTIFWNETSFAEPTIRNMTVGSTDSDEFARALGLSPESADASVSDPGQNTDEPELVPRETPKAQPLDVPYLNQNTVVPLRENSRLIPIGQSACGCTSVAMILAYAEKVPHDPAAMIKAVHTCYRATSRKGIRGIYAPEYLVRHLKNLGFTGTGFLPFRGAKDRFIFQMLIGALAEGLPQLLSVRAPSLTGHYLVVTGVEGDDPATAQLVVNDPNGVWEPCEKPGLEGKKCYNDPSGNGQNIRYSYAEIAKDDNNRLFVIREK